MVCALTGNFGQRTDPSVRFRQQAVDQRGLADAGLADEHADVPVKLALQALHAITVVCGHFQHRVTQRAVDRQQRIERGRILFVDQVGLVEQQQRTNPGMLGGHQIAVDQVGMRFGHRREDDHDQVDVGSHRLELAA